MTTGSLLTSPSAVKRHPPRSLPILRSFSETCRPSPRPTNYTTRKRPSPTSRTRTARRKRRPTTRPAREDPGDVQVGRKEERPPGPRRVPFRPRADRETPGHGPQHGPYATPSLIRPPPLSQGNREDPLSERGDVKCLRFHCMLLPTYAKPVPVQCTTMVLSRDSVYLRFRTRRERGTTPTSYKVMETSDSPSNKCL